jgi:hypothetical protein
MDTSLIIAFLTGGSLVASLMMGLIKTAYTDISARYGALITQVILFFVCLVIAAIAWSFQFVPTPILVTAGAIFSGAIVFYEVVYKAIFQQAIMNKTN